MFDSLVQVAAGFLPGLFFWAVLSLMAMAILEGMSSAFQWRSNYLKEGMAKILEDDGLTTQFFEHPLIISMTEQGNKRKNTSPKKPAYISSQIFAQILLDWVLNVDIRNARQKQITLAQFRRKILLFSKEHPKIGRIVNIMVAGTGIDFSFHEAGDVIHKSSQGLQNWFEDNMREVSRSYKNHLQRAALLVGFAIAIFVNFDLIALSKDLWSSADRKEIFMSAVSSFQVSTPNLQDAPSALYRELNMQIERLFRLPIGWYTDPCSDIPYEIPIGYGTNGRPLCLSGISLTPYSILSKLIGLIMGGVAIGIGAQFSYDTLRRRTPK